MPPKLQVLLRDNEAVARQSRKLATIDTRAPVRLNQDECLVRHYDRNRVIQLFRELEFFSLLERLPETADVTSDATVQTGDELPRNYNTITTLPALDQMLSRLSAVKSFALDVETDSLNSVSAQL